MRREAEAPEEGSRRGDLASSLRAFEAGPPWRRVTSWLPISSLAFDPAFDQRFVVSEVLLLGADSAGVPVRARSTPRAPSAQRASRPSLFGLLGRVDDGPLLAAMTRAAGGIVIADQWAIERMGSIALVFGLPLIVVVWWTRHQASSRDATSPEAREGPR